MTCLTVPRWLDLGSCASLPRLKLQCKRSGDEETINLNKASLYLHYNVRHWIQFTWELKRVCSVVFVAKAAYRSELCWYQKPRNFTFEWFTSRSSEANSCLWLPLRRSTMSNQRSQPRPSWLKPLCKLDLNSNLVPLFKVRIWPQDASWIVVFGLCSTLDGQESTNTICRRRYW